MIRVHGIPAFSDNYIWCIYDDETNEAIVVDPGSYKDTKAFLDENKLSLNSILITHHHPDHTGGIAKLKQDYECQCIASGVSHVTPVDLKLHDAEEVNLLGLKFLSLDVPGHTLDHNAYYCEDIEALFCGDTLFSGGCGRLFEGSAKQMYDSLQRINQLPDKTKLYCAHEYTLANLDFALSLMPNNQDLINYNAHTIKLREEGISTIPTTLTTEQRVNPFLRSDDPELILQLRKTFPEISEEAVAVFTATRQAKDSF
jgi:hydroxyacylglutathione hydrolase